MSAVTSSIKTSVLVPLAAIHALTYVRCLQHVWWILWYASDHESFFSFSILFSSPSFWYKFVISPKNYFFSAGSFMCFPCCKPSYFHSWKCLWFINLDNNMCNSWKCSWVGWMFFKLFFNHINSVITLWNCLLWSFRLFAFAELVPQSGTILKRTYQIVILATPIKLIFTMPLIDLFCFMFCFVFLAKWFHPSHVLSLGLIIKMTVKSSKIQIKYLIKVKYDVSFIKNDQSTCQSTVELKLLQSYAISFWLFCFYISFDSADSFSFSHFNYYWMEPAYVRGKDFEKSAQLL